MASSLLDWAVSARALERRVSIVAFDEDVRPSDRTYLRVFYFVLLFRNRLEWGLLGPTAVTTISIDIPPRGGAKTTDICRLEAFCPNSTSG